MRLNTPDVLLSGALHDEADDLQPEFLTSTNHKHRPTHQRSMMTPASRAQRRRSSIATMHMVADLLTGKPTTSATTPRSPHMTSQAQFHPDSCQLSPNTSPTLRMRRQQLDCVTEQDDVISDHNQDFSTGFDQYGYPVVTSQPRLPNILEPPSYADANLPRASLFSNASGYSQVFPGDSPPALFTRGRRGACGPSDTKECVLVQSKLKKDSVRPHPG